MAASENFEKEISAIKSSIYSFYRSWHLKSKEEGRTGGSLARFTNGSLNFVFPNHENKQDR